LNLQPRGFEGDMSPSWGACEGAGPLSRSRRGRLLGRPGDGWMVQFLSPAPQLNLHPRGFETVFVGLVRQENKTSADKLSTSTRLQSSIDEQRDHATHSRCPSQQGGCVDSVICQEVTSLASCNRDELTQRLQTYSWAQVFEVMDRLSRQGTLKPTRTGRFGYALSVGSVPPRLKLLQGRSSQALVQQNRIA